MTMTMQQILDRTPNNRKDKATYVKIKEVRVQRTAYKTVAYKAKTMSTHSNDGTPKKGSTTSTYLTMVETNGKMCVVSCSCEDFCFTWEYALNKKKAARIEYCNGESPKERNPRMVPGCCGHLVALGTKLIEKGKVI